MGNECWEEERERVDAWLLSHEKIDKKNHHYPIERRDCLGPGLLGPKLLSFLQIVFLLELILLQAVPQRRDGLYFGLLTH